MSRWSREKAESAPTGTDASASIPVTCARKPTTSQPQLDVERDEPEARLDPRVACRVSHRAPVLLVQQQRHLEGVAQQEEVRLGARAQLGVLQQPLPVLMAHPDERERLGRDLNTCLA